jgi:hypothetical protein
MPDDEIDERGRKARFEQWEKLGLDRVKHDLLDGGYRVVGGTLRVRDLAWEWVRMKEAELAEAAKKPPEILTLKPGAYGVSLDLKALGRKLSRWWGSKK